MPPKTLSPLPPKVSTIVEGATVRRGSKVMSVISPEYVFEATVSCYGNAAFTEEVKASATDLVSASVTPLGWVRDGTCIFYKLIDVATGDIAEAENEFLNAVHSSVASLPVGVELSSLRVSFNSSVVKLV